MNFEITLESIISIASLILGGTGIGTFFTWRWAKKEAAAKAAEAEAHAEKAKAEAEKAKVEMAQQVQAIYQQALSDKNEEVEDKNRIIQELRQDRDHFRQERNEYRQEVAQLKRDMDVIKFTQTRQSRQIDAMRPFLCADMSCRKRKSVSMEQTISNNESK